MAIRAALLATVALVAAVPIALTADRGSDAPVPSAGTATSPRIAPVPSADHFDERLAYRLVRAQVRLGPRPAGSPASNRLKRAFARLLPNGRLRRIPGHPGLHNVVGVVAGADPTRTIVVGAHHDTKDFPGNVGANDGASGTAVATALARSFDPRELEPRLVFILFDGEESPPGTPDSEFAREGLRGSKAAARRHSDAEAMILLDMVGDRDLSIERELYSNGRLWSRLRRSGRLLGTLPVFPPGIRTGVLDDHIPFRARGIPSINVIDFRYPCWHRPCDDLSRISRRSLDAVGETVRHLVVELSAG